LKVLIEARNENVINDLKTEIKTVPRRGSIAVFYGTGHMDDMEKRVTSELHYRAAEDIWLTAFGVDLRQADLSPTEVQMMRNLVKWQLDEMQR
jgi:deoxyribose-phosphate aldolase